MTIDIDETKVKRNEFGLWLAWTLTTALGMLIGYLAVALVAASWLPGRTRGASVEETLPVV